MKIRENFNYLWTSRGTSSSSSIYSEENDVIIYLYRYKEGRKPLFELVLIWTFKFENSKKQGDEMQKFRKAFKNKRVLLPVIHVEDCDLALDNAEIAHKAGADGIFLINHRITSIDMLKVFKIVRLYYPDFWVGMNFLDETALEAAHLVSIIKLAVSGLWVDNAHVEDASGQYPLADQIKKNYLSNWPGLYFGGFAFKYQKNVIDLEKAAAIAADYMDVITTSGDGTGFAPAVEKIMRIRKAAPEKPLAIASGITPENIDSFIPYADCFLVATGISHDFTHLDPDRVRLLVSKVRAFV